MDVIVAYITQNGLAVVGLITGLLCVWLLIKENVWTFPIGLIYAAVTVVVVARSNLYADVLLNLYYVLMNAYGWYFWLYGDQSRRREDNLIVGWVPGKQWPWLVAIGVFGTVAMGMYFDTQTNASLAYPDSATTVASFIAMWMSARKYIESWILWFAIDVVQIGLYLIKGANDPGLYLYALLYFVYLVLAVMGWRAWRAHTGVPEAAAEAA